MRLAPSTSAAQAGGPLRRGTECRVVATRGAWVRVADDAPRWLLTRHPEDGLLLTNFNAESERELLAAHEGDQLWVLSPDDQGWSLVCVKTGHVGLLPTSFMRCGSSQQRQGPPADLY